MPFTPAPSQSSPPPDLASLDRYLAQECHPDEQARVTAWLDAHPARRATMEALQGWPRPDVDAQKWLQYVKRAEQGIPLAKRPRNGQRSGMWGAAVVTAAIVAVMIPATWFVMAKSSGGMATEAIRIYTTQSAQHASLTLPDGSQVHLAPETTLDFSRDSDGGRIVTLQGQAFFTVVADNRHPFIVQTHSAVTQVLGTSFQVRQYEDEYITEVMVTDGKVAVGHEKPSTVLERGDRGAIEANTLPVVTRTASAADDIGWIRGELIFENVPLRRVIHDVRRMYGVEIRLATDAMAEQRVTVSFSHHGIYDALHAMAAALDLGYVQRDGVVVLSSR